MLASSLTVNLFYFFVFCDLELVMLLEWWSGTECTLFSDQATVDKFGKEHVIIILNHNFEIDFLCGWTMTERFGVLGVSSFNFEWFNHLICVVSYLEEGPVEMCLFV